MIPDTRLDPTHRHSDYEVWQNTGQEPSHIAFIYVRSHGFTAVQLFEELDFQQTPLGDISLRRRSEPRLNNEIIYEVKLGEEFLMSSLFVEAEEQLSVLGLAALKHNGRDENLHVVVGGLGLGYTALQVLEDEAVQSMQVIDVMQPVISWHQQGLLPIGNVLAKDERSTLIHADFFAMATNESGGFDLQIPSKKVDAVFLDIDHSPSHWLNEGNSEFYNQPSLQSMANKIHSGGVFGLWSNDLPDPDFEKLLSSVFINVASHVVSFPNPYTGGESINSVYVATIA